MNVLGLQEIEYQSLLQHVYNLDGEINHIHKMIVYKTKLQLNMCEW